MRGALSSQSVGVTVFDVSPDGATSMASPEPLRTRSSTTEPWRSSNQRERRDLPTTTRVALRERAKARTSSTTERPGMVTTSAPSSAASRMVSARWPCSASDKRGVAIGLDIERDQFGIEPVGGALGGAHGIGGGGAGIEADDHPLAGRPRAGNGMLAHVAQHLPVDALGGAAQRQLAQSRQVAGREVMAQRALGLLADIDLALAQALHQVGRREVDQLDLVGGVDDAVGHRLAHADTRDARHHVVEALDVLHVHGRVDVDAGAQKLLDVEIALGMAAAGGIGVGELVDQDQRRPALQDGVEVHLLEDAAAILDLAPRQHLEARELGLGLGAAVGLDDTDHDVDALFPAPARRLQHLVGLADARRGAEEDFQLAARFLLRRLQESVGRGAGIFTQGRHGRSLSPLGQRVEGQIEPQHVDPRLAQHAQFAAYGVLPDKTLQVGLLQTTCLGDPWHLPGGGRRRDMRIEAAGRGGYEVDRHALAQLLGIAPDPLDQRLGGRAEVRAAEELARVVGLCRRSADGRPWK